MLAAGDWYDAVYLSNDAILDNSDTRYTFWDSWNQPSLTPGQEYTLTQNINLSSSTVSGTRYLIFAADAGNNQSEISETNNLKIVPITVTGTGADLIVDPNGINAPSTIAIGNTASFSWRVRNQGDAATRNGWYDSIYLSDDTSFDSGDTKITETYRWWQGANSDYEVIQNNITIPITKTGNRFLLFVTDDRANEGESSETNNVVARPIEVKAAVSSTGSVKCSPSRYIQSHSPINPGVRLGYQGIYYTIKELGERAQIVNLTPHRLRHTYTTKLLLMGMDSLHARTLARHKSEANFKRYAKRTLSDAAEQAFYKAMGEEPPPQS